MSAVPGGTGGAGGKAEQDGPRLEEGEVRLAGEADLPELLALMRGYCDFYGALPADEELRELSRALFADPEREGVQLIGRDRDGGAVGFATVYWTWSTLTAARMGVMNDLFVIPEARGRGHADALIAACVEQCALRGAGVLAWQTAKDNARAQRVYERAGARREEWLDYWLPVKLSGSPS